jgi:hypothetical protein
MSTARLDRQLKDATEPPGATIGERRQHRVLGSSDGIEAAADQHFDVRIGLGNGAKNLPST